MGAVASAQSANARIDSMFARWHTPESPGAAVLVVQDGKVLHAKGYGMANLEYGVPISTSTVFDIASVSKQFGAMAIALLEADGRIAMDDDVRKYIPELHDFGQRITIRHLVHHTSGIRDWPGTMRIGGWSFHDVISFEQILRFAFEQRDLNFKPGDDYAYSNTGYNLLAEVVKRVSGKSFRQFTAERIFEPLGMTNTHFHDNHAEIVRNRAESYRTGSDGAFYYVPNHLTALGSSSLFTTVEDLGKWVANYDKAIVGGEKLITRTHERGILNKGDTIPYAFGQNVMMVRGVRTVSHGGSWAGYRSQLQRYPDHKLSVIILSNVAELNPALLANRIGELYLGDKMSAPSPTTAQPQNRPATPWTPSPEELRAYTGKFESAELLTSWSLALRDNRLVATHFRGGDYMMMPLEKDRFQSGVFGEVRFVRDNRGAITGFTANSDRIRGLRFNKMRMN
jgi:CubicO group peptidase (beta-lactamase class C family)